MLRGFHIYTRTNKHEGIEQTELRMQTQRGFFSPIELLSGDLKWMSQ